MQVVKKEDKETKISEFIACALSQCQGSSNCTLTLIARSADSPVSRALVNVSAELAAKGIAVRAIFASDTELAAIALAHPRLFDEVRLTRNVRLLDAHEQLVTDPSNAWIGDTMRRDPAKRDAYENYAPGDAELARWANTCFERLWRHTEPIEIERPRPPAPPVEHEPAPEQIDPLVMAALELQQIPAATRH